MVSCAKLTLFFKEWLWSFGENSAPLNILNSGEKPMRFGPSFVSFGDWADTSPLVATWWWVNYSTGQVDQSSRHRTGARGGIEGGELRLGVFLQGKGAEVETPAIFPGVSCFFFLVWGFPKSCLGTPSHHHPFRTMGIFHDINHPAILRGTPMTWENSKWTYHQIFDIDSTLIIYGVQISGDDVGCPAEVWMCWTTKSCGSIPPLRPHPRVDVAEDLLGHNEHGNPGWVIIFWQDLLRDFSEL